MGKDSMAKNGAIICWLASRMCISQMGDSPWYFYAIFSEFYT